MLKSKTSRAHFIFLTTEQPVRHLCGWSELFPRRNCSFYLLCCFLIIAFTVYKPEQIKECKNNKMSNTHEEGISLRDSVFVFVSRTYVIVITLLLKSNDKNNGDDDAKVHDDIWMTKPQKMLYV